MEIRSTGIEGLHEVIPQSFQGNRGWFLELFKVSSLKEFGLTPPFLVQDNHPKSETGINRNDPKLKIDWRIEHPVLSEKDKHFHTLQELSGKIIKFTKSLTQSL